MGRMEESESESETEWWSLEKEMQWVGLGFSLGTIGGFGYNLLKSKLSGSGLGTAFGLACRKAPRVGSVGAGLVVVSDAVHYADFAIRHKSDYLNTFLGTAAAGAALKANHGILSLTRSALAVGTSLTLLYAAYESYENKPDMDSSSSSSSSSSS